MSNKALLLVVSSPSGAGKTTLTRMLMKEFPDITFSISYTTRPPREGERDGVDYHFVDEATFEAMVERDEFAEWAKVHGFRYGTADETIRESLAAGRSILFDIDYQGGRQLKTRYPNESLMVFILPPDLMTLSERLHRRATDDEAVIQRRLAKAVVELGHYHAYEYLIINEDLHAAYEELRAVYLAARCRWDRQSDAAEALIRQAAEPAFRRAITPLEK